MQGNIWWFGAGLTTIQGVFGVQGESFEEGERFDLKVKSEYGKKLVKFFSLYIQMIARLRRL